MKNFELYPTYEEAKNAYEKRVQPTLAEWLYQEAQNAVKPERKAIESDADSPTTDEDERPMTVKFDDDGEVLFVDDATGEESTLLQYPCYVEGHYDPVTHPCRMVHIKTKNLCAHEADFYVRLADLAKGAMLPKGKWCDKDEKYYDKKLQGATDSIESSDDEAWNGRKSTSNMLSHQSEIAAKVNEETCNILPNAPLRHAFIGTVLQYKELWSKKELLKDALSFFHLQSAMDDSCWYWTSTQYASYAGNAWNWGVSLQAWASYHTKTNPYVCVPFFTI